MLTLRGHGLSTDPAGNLVRVGTQPCEVLTAATLGAYTYSPWVAGHYGHVAGSDCPVVSCRVPRDVIELTCRLGHNHAFGAHDVRLTVDGAGSAPAVDALTVTTGVQLRSVDPDGGSIAGGTLLTLLGDGFSQVMCMACAWRAHPVHVHPRASS